MSDTREPEGYDAEGLEGLEMLARLARERGVDKLSDLGDLPPLSAAERWRLTRTPESETGTDSGAPGHEPEKDASK